MATTAEKQNVKADVEMLAERIVRYESKEKGFMGKLFGFEARDGFWSKLVKTLSPLSAASTTALSVFALVVIEGFLSVSGIAGAVALTTMSVAAASPALLIGAGVAAVAAGLCSAAMTRAVNKSVFTDLHDSHRGNWGKFGHYMGIGLVGAAILTALTPLLPAAAVLSTLMIVNMVSPLSNVISNKAIAAGLGDQPLRQESAAARELAQQVMHSGKSMMQSRGQSIARAAGQEQSVSPAPSYALAEGYTPVNGTRRTDFTQMIEQQRAIPKLAEIS